MNTNPSTEDLARMHAIQQKRTLAFVNHLVMTNVQCLNNFMQVCEDKLMQFEEKLDRVDAAMVLLESKLLSIPEVNAFAAEVEAREGPTVLEPISEDLPVPQDPLGDTTPQATHDEIPPTNECSNARAQYERYVKMVQVGVPLQAAKLKCALEGLDPNVLAEIIGKIIQKYAEDHKQRLHHHVNVEVIQLLDNTDIVRRLKRTKPFQLV